MGKGLPLDPPRVTVRHGSPGQLTSPSTIMGNRNRNNDSSCYTDV